MLYQSLELKEFQFLFYLIPVSIGIELVFYFYYQYFKIRDVKLKLNRVLLAFGTFILFIITGPLFIQISRNFLLEGSQIYEVLSRVGWGLAFLSTIGFSLFIINKNFSQIINVNIVKLLLILNFIPLLVLIFTPSTRAPIFLISITFVVLNGINIIRFQIILIKRSVGKIKRKFIFFLLGALVSFPALGFAILVGIGVLPPIINEIVYFTGVAFLLLGMIIISFSVYEFPPFYEFEWRDNLLKLFIINQKTGEYIYYHEFIDKLKPENEIRDSLNELSQHDEAKLYSGGILGIESVITTITDTKEEKINKIKQKDSVILLSYSSVIPYITYALIIRKDLLSLEHLLDSIKQQFEGFYREILLNLESLKGDQKLLFQSFDVILRDLLNQ
ncbi:MAG: hypothetical protein ACFE9J_15435 [Candidatus Hermodarchaeota archaeon]